MSSIRIVVAVAATRKDIRIEQLDIATAYLNGEVQEEIFMEVLDHVEEALNYITQARQENNWIRRAAKMMLEELEKSNIVCRLNKVLYGL